MTFVGRVPHEKTRSDQRLLDRLSVDTRIDSRYSSQIMLTKTIEKFYERTVARAERTFGLFCIEPPGPEAY